MILKNDMKQAFTEKFTKMKGIGRTKSIFYV